MLSLTSAVVQSKDVASCNLAGETAIIHLESGNYFGLDEVGTRIWTLIQEPKRIDDILDVLLSEYEVEAAEGERDLLDLLRRLHDEALVTICNAAVS